ncbi:Rpn family recombination-promoting nuclease/putative transposase [Fibrobacter sp. UWEL]|uniref:Rpn family recombination-promoting nuclease/putative transposase n=1 Tax=Fibrobacter sp. UWEL TaxID=1896209 RepID=UPI0013566443|nr:Rpn family recombination-promoting nuclease/putative transposase [Fibrobacter sp. UWEL]
MNKSLRHDSFCRDGLADVSTFLEFVEYLASQNADLLAIINLLDLSTLERIPADFSDTANTGYADLAFRAKVKKEYLRGGPVQVCVGFLVEHKSYMDDEVLEQLRKYHYHLMVEKLKENAVKGIPSVAIILYNGKDDWNPLEKLDDYPDVLRDIVLPFKGVFVDVDDVPDETCIEKFSPRLGAFIVALKYSRDPEAHKDVFKKVLDRIGTPKKVDGTLDLVASIDVYLNGWLSKTFEEELKMDFVRPPYETIADAQRKRQEALEKKLAEKDAEIADKDAENASLAAENASQAARIKELEAALAAK